MEKQFVENTDPQKAIEYFDRYLSRIILWCRGRNMSLRSTKPKYDGLTAYVWRQLRFYGGVDLHLPIMCEFELMNWYETFYEIDRDNGIVLSCFDKGLKAFGKYIDSKIDDIIKTQFPDLDPTKCLRAWSAIL